MLLNYAFMWITASSSYITDGWDWAFVKLSVIVIIIKSIIVQGWYFRRCPWVATNAWEMGRVCGGKCRHQKSANNLIFQIIFHLVFSCSILIINNRHWRKDLPMQAVWLQKQRLRWKVSSKKICKQPHISSHNYNFHKQFLFSYTSPLWLDY